MIAAPGQTSQSIDVQIVDDTGLAVTGLIAATFPAVLWSLSGNTAATSITLSDLAAIISAYNSGGVFERSGGYYRLDIPDAALASVGEVKLIGEASGKHLVCSPIIVSNLERAAKNISVGVVGSGSIATSINVSSLTPGVTDTDQLKGRIIIFNSDTTSSGLRNESSDITGNTTGATPTLTVTALSSAPTSGDKFIIV